MATKETQQLDSIIASRRSLLMGGGALATMVLAGQAMGQATTPAPVTDNDVLNFALNLEYLEAQFYTLATEGVTADQAATGKIALGTNPGTVTVKANPRVQFQSAAIGAYAFETALEERHHVTFLQGALTSANFVPQPNIDLMNSFTALGTLIGVPTFDPFSSDLMFLLGAYIFEDVGVTAYHGGAALLSSAVLTPAVEIHAVEAYHAGLVRTTLFGIDQGVFQIPGMAALPAGYLSGPTGLTQKISNVRAQLDGTLGNAPDTTDTVGLSGQDDFGLSTINVPLNTGTATFPASTILDTGRTTAPFYSNYIGFARTTTQVLNIVYADLTKNKVPGGFFPKGLNGTVK